MSAAHVIGAALGGAVLGITISLSGAALDLPQYRGVVGVLAGMVALLIAVRRPAAHLGRQRQVPRAWGRNMPPTRAYFLWGVLLGAGGLTVVPYSSYVIVIAAEATTRPVVAALVGMTFGTLREAASIWLSLTRTNPRTISDSLPQYRTIAYRANLVFGVSGSLALMATSLAP